MNLNPFEILKNAQELQARMGEMQEKLKGIFVTGSSGGGMAQVTMNGQLDVVSVKIAPEAVDPADVALLEDLVRSAFNDATEKAKEAAKNELGSLAGGMGLPKDLLGGFPQ
jgi:nucleoid-associated protein EbfC